MSTTPNLFAPPTISWRHDPIQHQVYLRCNACGVESRRAWADKYSPWPQNWISEHVCAVPA